jgi:8-oxo-dGTP pyrophosphatase MutT (NUDIX family)
VRSEPGPHLILFQARYDWVKNPRTGKSMRAVVLETADWVNVVALTPAGKIVCVHQHRFGVGKSTLEIPAGLIESGETPEQAARRELEEETGYTSAEWESLGSVQANPAFLNNHCHLWLALNVEKTHPMDLDENEDIEVTELTLAEIKDEIRAGRMLNALTLLGLSRVFDLREASQQKRFQ